MSDSEKKPQKQLRNSTMRGFVQSLNEKLEKAGQPLASLPSVQKQKSDTNEYQVIFIKKKRNE